MAALAPPLRFDPLVVSVSVALVESVVASVILFPAKPGCREIKWMVARPASSIASTLGSPLPALISLVNVTAIVFRVVSVDDHRIFVSDGVGGRSLGLPIVMVASLPAVMVPPTTTEPAAYTALLAAFTTLLSCSVACSGEKTRMRKSVASATYRF